MTRLFARQASDAVSAIESASNLESRLFCRLPEIYLVVALLVCGFLCILTPPFFVPDEVNHAKRELELGRGEMLAHETSQGVGSAVDAGVLNVMALSIACQAALRERFPIARERPDGRIHAAQLAQMQQVRWAGVRVFTDFRNTALYPPLLYLPQVLGWRLGELAGAPVVESLWLARLVTALSAILLGWLALRLAGDGGLAILLCLLLPTELGLNASCSQDALLLPAACLAAVLLARSVRAARPASVLELAGVVLLLSACIGARLPYLPMAFAILLPLLNLPQLEMRAIWRHGVALLAIVLLVGGWASLVRPFGVTPDAAANPALQTAFVLHQPLRAAVFLLRGTMAVVPVLTVMGFEVLGCNDVFAPLFIYGLLAVGGAAVLWLAPRPQLVGQRARLLLLVILLGTMLLLSLSEYLIWTPVRARYYLPLLPFALLLTFWMRPPLPRWLHPAPPLRGKLLLAATALFLVAVLATPWIAARRFYNLGPIAAIRLSRLSS